MEKDSLFVQGLLPTESRHSQSKEGNMKEPEIGDTVYWFDPDEKKRTGVFVRVVDKGKKYSMAVVEPTAYKARKVFVPMDRIGTIKIMKEKYE